MEARAHGQIREKPRETKESQSAAALMHGGGGGFEQIYSDRRQKIRAPSL